MVEVPTALDAVRAIEQIRAHGGLMCERPAIVLAERIAHLEQEADGLARVCDEQHHELVARDLCPACAELGGVAHGHGGALGSPGDQWGRAVGAAGPVGRSTDADGSNHAGV